MNEPHQIFVRTARLFFNSIEFYDGWSYIILGWANNSFQVLITSINDLAFIYWDCRIYGIVFIKVFKSQQVIS